MYGEFYFTKPEAISRFLTSVIRAWGYPVRWNKSDYSESQYLKVCLGSREAPKSLHIRISDHTIPPKKLWVKFDVDVYCGFEREGAISYMKLLSRLTEELDKPLPLVLTWVNIGTPSYIYYQIEMQRRRKLAGKGRVSFAGERFYV